MRRKMRSWSGSGTSCALLGKILMRERASNPLSGRQRVEYGQLYGNLHGDRFEENLGGSCRAPLMRIVFGFFNVLVLSEVYRGTLFCLPRWVRLLGVFDDFGSVHLHFPW